MLRRVLGSLFPAAILTIALLAPALAHATDLADEADLHFRMGNDRVSAGDYRQALAHYLLSNRLAPNKNVVFNIASMYEELQQFPDAYRYYTEAIATETDSARKASLESAIARILPRIAVVHVTSDPPGATIYVNRRDLGPRGTTPQTLAFFPGEYKILMSARGYHDNESGTIAASAGSKSRVSLKLEQVLGRVLVEASAPGLVVHARDLGLTPTPLPATLALPPGEHILSVEGPLHDSQPLRVMVAAGSSARVTADPPRKRGNLLVLGSQRGAVILVDGQPKAFVPAVIELPVGKHRVTVSQEGYRDETFAVDITPKAQRQLEVELSPVDRVMAVSRQIEEVEDAPGSVSLIPSWELRAMQYPTILQALRGVRGVFVGDDHTYDYVGVRGFARPGDYGNRLLVLLDGHPLNDNYLGSSYVGFDARTDLDDLERIELVRGAGSVLYGTGALSGVVNLVTRRPEDEENARVSVSSLDAGVMRANARVSLRLGESSGVWMSVGGAKGQGSDFEFPEYVAPGSDGRARGIDGFEAGTVGGRLWSGPATLQWFLHTRKKTIPTGAYDTLFPDPRNVVEDTRATMEAKVETSPGPGFDVLHRAYLHGYHFESTRPYDPEDGGLAEDDYVGIWAGLEERVAWQVGDAFRLTLGGELQRHLRARQFGEDDDQVYLDRNDPYTVLAGYALVDADLHDRLRVSLGNRVDWFSSFGLAVTPRGAFNIQPYEAGRIKIMGGKAFRAPSVFELHFNDGGLTQVASPDLEPETSIYGEVEVSHRFTPTVTALLAGYVTSYSNLIVALGDGTQASPTFFENSEADVLATGAEVEARREWREGWAMSGSYTYQRLRYVGDTEGLREVPNSPRHLASMKLTVPLLARALRASNRISVEGPRFDRNETEDDPPQSKIGGSVIWDAVLSSATVIKPATWTFSAGVYNAFDKRYSIPLSREHRQLSLVQTGRTFLLSVASSL